MSITRLLSLGACIVLTLALTAGDALSAGKGGPLTEKQVKKFKEKKPKKDKRSGNSGRNRHFVSPAEPGIEIVSGKITEVRSGGIMMDGVYFGLSSAVLVDDFGKVLRVKDLYVGLEVSLRHEFGRVVRLVSDNYIRTGVITDRREIMKKLGSKLPTNPLRQGGSDE